LSGRGLCDELITLPEESYRLCCVVCDLETSRMGAPYIYDISHLRVNHKTFCHETDNRWWCTALLKKLVITDQETTSLYGKWSFIVYENVPLRCTLSHCNLIYAFTFSQDTFVISLRLPRLLFLPVFPIKVLYAFLICPCMFVCFTYNKLKSKGIWDVAAWSDDTPKNFHVFLTWKITLVHNVLWITSQ